MEINPHNSIPAKKPIRRLKDLPPIPYDPKLNIQSLQDLEGMNRQSLVELDVSKSDSSPASNPMQYWMILDQIKNGGQPPEH